MEPLPPIIHESWHPYLQPLFDDSKMQLLKHEILPKQSFLPESRSIFRVFSMPLWAIKVVIIGQDPYPNPGEATGHAFAVSGHVKPPKSLLVIINEVVSSRGFKDINNTKYVPPHEFKTLQHWVDQGVFLLNAALTVEIRNAGSHMGYWQWFTREVIGIISAHNKCVWMLWGKKAQGFRDYVNNKVVIQPNDSIMDIINPEEGKIESYILECDHPAAEAYNGGTSKTKFTGSRIFIRCNEVLKAKGERPINW